MIIIDCYIIPNRILIPKRIYSSHCVRLKKQKNCVESYYISGMIIRPGRTHTPTTGYFHDKTKISKANLRVNYCLQLKYCKRQYTLLPLPGPNYIQILAPKCKIINVFWA